MQAVLSSYERLVGTLSTSSNLPRISEAILTRTERPNLLPRAVKEPPSHIVSRRVELGLTQADVAKACNTIQQTVAKLELGERKLTIDWAEKLAVPLRWTPSQVLFGQSTFKSARIIGALLPSEAVDLTIDHEVVELNTPLPDVHAQGDYQAVRVSTDALEPRFYTGDLLVFGTIPTEKSEMVGRECLVLNGDHSYVRRVEAVNGDEVLLTGYRRSTATITISAEKSNIFRLISIIPA